MAYTAIDDPEAYFQVVLYTGDGAVNEAITLPGDTDMQPDFVWIKRRDANGTHCLFDSVRGATKFLSPDDTGAEATDTDTLDSFASDGFQVDDDTKVNTDGATYVAWCWKAGGSTASNSSGDITSTVSVDTTVGFSITSYTGNNSNDQTVGHSLSAVPHLMIIKNRDDTNGWIVYHHKNTSAPETDYLGLNGSGATTDDDGIFNDTAPTSTLFTIGDESDVGAGTGGNTEKIIAYLWSEKQGFSKFGGYTGNGNADGPFVYTGFKPAFVIFKRFNTTGEWGMFDNKRNPYNVATTELKVNAIDPDETNGAVDFCASGFKLRETSVFMNGDGDTYIYIAFAEAPLVNSNGVPCNAR